MCERKNEVRTYFENFKDVLQCMEAFHKDTGQSEMKRYADSLIQLLAVMRAIQNVAFDQTDGEILKKFDYVDVKDWLICDWAETFPETDEETWKKLNTCDYSAWGYDSPEDYWRTIENFCSSGEEVLSEELK